MVTLPCHPELIVTKSLPMSVTKISREKVDQVFPQDIDIEVLGSILNNDVSEVVVNYCAIFSV
jgi:hypothetical protein